MIDKIFEWAWKCGLDVSLTSKNWGVQLYEAQRFRPREKANFVTMGQVVCEKPILRFSREGRHYEIYGDSWADLLVRLKATHRQIWAELMVEELDLKVSPRKEKSRGE